MMPRAARCVAAAVIAAGLASAAGQPIADTPPARSAASPSADSTAGTGPGGAPLTSSEDRRSAAIPPGISDFDLEVFAAYAYTWVEPSQAQVIECIGECEVRMGPYRLRSLDAVLWFKRVPWRDRPYYEVEVFLWREAEVRQPAGTVEQGEALYVSLRSFGKLVLNTDAQADESHADGELYKTASQVRAAIGAPTTRDAEAADLPVNAPPSLKRMQLPKRPPGLVTYRSDDLTSEVHDGRRIMVAIGNVYVGQGAPKAGDFLELRADAAVLYLEESKLSEALPGGISVGPSAATRPAATQPAQDIPATPGEERLKDEKDARAGAREFVEAVYLEGDVILTRGARSIRATRIFYDLKNDRALILDAVMRALEPQSNLPIYVRAAEVRQLSETEYKAIRPNISSSEFHTPHASLGASEATLIDRTPRNERGDVTGVTAGQYTAKDTTLNVEGVPLLYWPVAKGDFSNDRQAFRSAKAGYDNRLGATVETRWELFNLLGLEAPVGHDATLHVDEYTDRGPGVGIDSDYVREDYLGLLRTNYQHDDGEDKLSRQRSTPPPTDDRGRILWRHRQFLPKGWELSLEASYISDDQYLQEWDRNEFENGKEQETVAYLVKREDNWQFSTLFNTALNDFVPVSEHYPDARFTMIGEPVGDLLSFYHDSRLSAARLDTGNNPPDLQRQNIRDSDGILRGDAREEVTMPMEALGPVKLTPYGTIRGGAWDDSPMRGGVQRVLGTYGLKGNMYLQRTFDEVESRLLDLHRLRHVVKPEFTVWNAHGNLQSSELYPLDGGVETVDDLAGGSVGMRNRWQTQRGEPGRYRTVDWITLDVQAAFFSNARPLENTHGNFIDARPEDSISSNNLSVDFLYRVSDTTAVVYDGVYDWNTGNVGTSNISLALEREPRNSAFIGWRYIHETDNNLIGAGSAYRLSEKYTVAVREYYDIDLNRNGETQIAVIRRWPRWHTAVVAEWDRAIDDFSISFAVWPEGSRISLGSRRYTGFSESVGLRP